MTWPSRATRYTAIRYSYQSAGSPGRSLSKIDGALAKILERSAGMIEITDILGSTPVDLGRLGAAGDRHSKLKTELLRFCNTSLLGFTEPVESLEQAAVRLGSEALRTVSLAWGIVETVSRSLPAALAQAFWQHGLAVALLSERLAARSPYPLAEAHLAGFLHDVGRVPLLMLAEDEARLQTSESLAAEALKFGVDHCELGRRIGLAWRFPDVFVGAFSRHHRGRLRRGDALLVLIVSEAEALCARQASANEPFHADGNPNQTAAAVRAMSPIELLELEFLDAARRRSPERPELEGWRDPSRRVN